MYRAEVDLSDQYPVVTKFRSEGNPRQASTMITRESKEVKKLDVHRSFQFKIEKA